MPFEAPQVGKTVTVTTRFRDIWYYSTREWEDKTYTGQVGRPDRSVPQGSFMLLTPQDSRMPTRVISLARVIDLRYADGDQAAQRQSGSAVKTWQVEGSRGAVYTVTQRGADKTCTCPGFTFRESCKHVQ
jgi:hypothetical protein